MIWCKCVVVVWAVLWSVVEVNAATRYVCQADGSDSDNGTTAALAKATINAGIGIMAGGDTLEICGGNYPELLVGSVNGSMTPPSYVLAVQPGTKVLPSGPSCGSPTRLVARTGHTVNINPTVQNSDTRNIVTLYQTFSANMLFDGLNFLIAGATDEAASAGVFFGDSSCITIRNGEVKGGGIKASGGSSGLLIEFMHVHSVGTPWCDFSVGSPYTGGPCPHLMYVCGDNHIIRNNWGHDAGHSGLHISCEQSNSDNVLLRDNIITDLPGYGIIIDGGNNLITANRIERAGTGVFATGSTTKILNNTISSWFTATPSWVPDPFAITYVNAGVIRNNLILSPKSAFNTIRQQQFNAINTGQVHHNLCTVSGNAGCTLSGTTSNLVTNYSGGDFTLKVASPARGAGVVDIGTTVDILGITYPSPPDIGAYAFSEDVGDVTAPVVSITTPAQGATVSGTVSVEGSASDNVGVVGVQFKLNGGNLGGEDVVAAYSVSWNTLAVSNGAHVLTAVARDAAGNSTTSGAISVTVNNAGMPTGSDPRPTTMFFSK